MFALESSLLKTPFRPFGKVFARICKTINYAMCCKSVVYEHCLRFCILHFQKIDDYVDAKAVLGLCNGPKIASDNKRKTLYLR